MNNLISKYWKYAAGLLLLIVVLIGVNSCNRYKRLTEDLQAQNDYKAQTIASLQNQNGLLVAQQKVVQTNNTADIKRLSAQLFDLKKKDEKKITGLQALITAQQVLTIHDTVIHYTDSGAANKDSLVHAGDVILPGRPFEVSNSYYRVHGKVLLSGVRIDSANFYNQVSFRVGYLSKGIFSAKQLTVQAINSNPLIKFTGMNSIVLKPKTSAWNRWIKPVLFSAAASLVTYKIVK